MRNVRHENGRQLSKPLREGPYQHVVSRTVRPIVLLDKLLPLLPVVLILPHIRVDLRVAYVEHEEDTDEHEEI